MQFFQDLWDDYGLIGAVFILLCGFFAFRLYQLLFERRRLKREGLVGQIFAQVVIAGIFCIAGAIVCWPELVGLHREELGLPPRKTRIADKLGIATVDSKTPEAPVVSKLPPQIKSWDGVFVPVKLALERDDSRGLAKALFDASKDPARRADIGVIVSTHRQVGSEFLALAQEAATAKEWTKALALLDYACDLGANDPEPFYQRALVRRVMQPKPDMKGALADLDIAIRKAKPGDVRAIERRLEIHLNETPPNLRGALGDLDLLVAAKPADAQLLLTRARRRLDVNLLEPAIADLTSAAKVLTRDVGLRIDLVGARLRLNQSEQALRDVEDVLKLSPNDGRAIFLRGVTYFQLRKPDLALPDFARSIKSDPRNAEAYYYRGRILFDQNQLNPARADFDEAIKHDPKHRNAYYWRGVMLRDIQPPKALDDLTRACELEPGAWASYFRGEVLWKLKRVDEAEKAFADAVSQADEPTRKQVEEWIRKLKARFPRR